MRIPLLAGRSFTDTDRRDTPLVMLLNETAARQLFPGENAVGQRVACCEPGPDGVPRLKLVVGIVGDVRGQGLHSDPQPQFYLPIAQVPPVAWNWIQRSMTIVARGRTVDPAVLTGALRAAVDDVDPGVALYNVATMEQRLAATLAPRRFNTALMLVLGAVGLLLASIGIYGVISYVVTPRQREIAIRVALGAPGRRVVGMIVAHAIRPVLLGVGLGTAGALAVSQVLASYLFRVTTRDPLTLTVAIAVLAAAALAATAIPARRAAAVDPARTLTST
jgi:membrane-associated protease RseP (regulator of RpoE activity)